MISLLRKIYIWLLQIFKRVTPQAQSKVNSKEIPDQRVRELRVVNREGNNPLNLSESRKGDIVFKKIVGRRFTTTEKAWYEDEPGKLTTIHAQDVWTAEIPTTPPSNDTVDIKVYDDLKLTEDNSVANHRSWLACETYGDTSTQLTGFIPPRFGQGYTVRIYEDNGSGGLGSEIPTTHPSEWFFDYENGVLTFENDPTNFGLTLPIHIKGYRYIGTDLKNTQGKYDVVITQGYIPDYVQNTLGSIKGLLNNHLLPTGIIDRATTFYATHYRRFKWQVIGSVTGASKEQHFDDYDSLLNYLVNTRSNTTQNITLIFKHTIDNQYPTVDYIYGYNMFYAALKSRGFYYKKRWCIELNDNNWEKIEDFISGLYSFYFGVDTSSQNMSDLAHTVWFPINYRRIYRPIPLGFRFRVGNTHDAPNAGLNNRAFWNAGHNDVVYTTAIYEMMVVDRFVSYRTDRSSFFFEKTPLRDILNLTREIETIVVVYVLHDPENNYYAFLIKPLGQDKFVIYNDPRISELNLDLYVIYEDSTVQLRRWYRNLTQSMNYSEVNKNSAQAKYIIDRRDLLYPSRYTPLGNQTKDLKHPAFKIRFMWADAEGNTSRISRTFIAGRVYPAIAPELLVRTG